MTEQEKAELKEKISFDTSITTYGAETRDFWIRMKRDSFLCEFGDASAIRDLFIDAMTETLVKLIEKKQSGG
jgi:hypothetical protein